MATKSPTLPDAVRVAEEITDESLGDEVLATIRSRLSDQDKARIYDRFDEGDISKRVAKELLGETEFDIADATTRGSRQILSNDTSRYLSD